MTSKSLDKEKNSSQFATFGAGCFWGVESLFAAIPGIINTAVGYMGGKTANPTYEEVCSDESGHVEVVQMRFDPNVVKYETLLNLFFENHNPTSMNSQGPDEGTQYRSVIFYHNAKQQEIAQQAKDALDKSGKWKRPIVTAIEPAAVFYRAEEYHQKYLAKHGRNTCHF